MIKPPPFESPLERWLWANRQKRSWLAKQLNVSPALITLILQGKRGISPELGEAIKKITGLKRL